MSGWRSAHRREMQLSEKEALKKLIQRFSIIGRVIASDRQIKVLNICFCLIIVAISMLKASYTIIV